MSRAMTMMRVAYRLPHPQGGYRLTWAVRLLLQGRRRPPRLQAILVEATPGPAATLTASAAMARLAAGAGAVRLAAAAEDLAEEDSSQDQAQVELIALNMARAAGAYIQPCGARRASSSPFSW